MKLCKILCIVFLICLLLLPLVPDVQAAEHWEDGWNEAITYEFDDKTGTVTLSGNGELTVNATYKPWGNYRHSVKKVVIGEGITAIGRNAFDDVPYLTEVVLPESVTAIGRSAFVHCNQLASIDISRVEKLEDYAFSGCWALTVADIGSLTALGEYAFERTGLRSVTIPESITVIPRRAFSSCSRLEKVVLHDGITSIGYGAFDNCGRLTSLCLPKALKELEDYAFSDCLCLTDIQLNEGLERIGRGALRGCEVLKELVIPDSVIEIRDYAFKGCTSLRAIHFGKKLSDVNYSAFQECPNLITFTINKNNPNWEVHNQGLYNKKTRELEVVAPGYEGAYVVAEGTLTIGRDAFRKRKITSVSLPDSVKVVEDYAFADCESLKTVDLGEGVEKIGLRSFTCSGITEITIPASVKKMGSEAFSDCTSLTKIVFQGLPPEVGDTFPEKGEVYVYYPGYMPEWKNADVNGLGYYFDYIPDCQGRHDLRWEVIKAPTCQKAGWRSETWCAVCRQTVDPEGAIPAVDHSYGGWTTVTAPTAEKEGLSKRTCMNCSATEQKVLPKQNASAQQPTRPTTPPETEPTQPTRPTTPPETEPSQPTRPTTPPETEPSQPTQPTTPPETEPSQPPTEKPLSTHPSEPETTEPDPESETGEKTSPGFWAAVATIAVISILIGMVASLLIFTFKKAKK